MALVGALLVSVGLVVTSASSGASEGQYCMVDGVTQGPPDGACCPHGDRGGGGGVTQGPETDVCCATDLITPRPAGVTQGGGNDIGVKCCADGTFGHWQWGGPNGQNLYWCEEPPPPTTAPPATDPPAVSPATAAPKKAAAAAKPTFTG